MAIITDGVRTKFTDDTGLPLIGGQVFSYVEGTSTPKDTYQDRAFEIPNTNPIILDDAGSCQMYLNGGYRLRVLTAGGVLVEEKDNAFQSDGQVLDVVANTTAIAALQTNVNVLNTRGGLKTDENNHIIGQGKAESATVYDLSLRSDKIRVSAPTDVEFGDLVFKTYDAPTVVNGVTIPNGTWLNPALVVPLLGTAATRNIGSSSGDVMTVSFQRIGQTGYPGNDKDQGSLAILKAALVADTIPHLSKYWIGNYGGAGYPSAIFFRMDSTSGISLLFSKYNVYNADKFPRMLLHQGIGTASATTTQGDLLLLGINVTKDANGFLKAASPVVKVFADKVELNDDAVNQNVTYKKNGVGDYTITTASGLSTDGWYIELPKDMNGNPKVAVTLSEVEGVITLKSYKRIFSMETFTFVPDLDNPLDIPDGRWIDLRLNELPVEPAQQTTP